MTGAPSVGLVVDRPSSTSGPGSVNLHTICSQYLVPVSLPGGWGGAVPSTSHQNHRDER